MRENRRDLTASNIVEACDDNPEFVFDTIQGLIDVPEFDIPDEEASIANVIRVTRLTAYYANAYPYLINLWGVMRLAAAESKSPNRMAMRDYLEKAASACKLKYEGASRVMTGYDTVMNEPGPRTL
ncbi:MAG: hypothetical protein NVSMB14_02530 [Isosphaeraceae bacterium]